MVSRLKFFIQVDSSIVEGFFNQTSQLRCTEVLHAVKKLTREVKALVRESVPWYKGEGREMGKM